MLSITNHQGNANQNCNEIAILTGVRCYHQKTTNNKWWPGCGEMKILVYCSYEYKFLYPTMENNMEVSQKS